MHPTFLDSDSNLEVGEIASRIAQLYCGQYRRTSDSSYLAEAFVFYEAVLDREYLRAAAAAAEVALAYKQLRLLVRFQNTGRSPPPQRRDQGLLLGARIGFRRDAAIARIEDISWREHRAESAHKRGGASRAVCL
uniref:Uncharacterized protein n=1 Tax=Ananas comosus var. bracteatus TaxID=296719 RepID=A0A6V7Q1Q1_ANACO|nr:unnamed protein product [Ananas comosus var. bracteatus]